MSEEWKWQVRINLKEEFAKEVKMASPNSMMVQGLLTMLVKHNAVLKNQYDAFADFCKDVEARGDTDTVLYRWTKDLLNNPKKKEQYATRFTIYADGGKEVYSKEVADALEADLQRYFENGMITKINKIDSNPANNPQAPARFH